jgi:EpsI family protein
VSGAVGYLALLAAVSLAVPPWIAIDPQPLGLETRFSERLGGWRGAPDALDPLFLGSVSFRESVAARYQQGAEQVELFVGVGDRAHRAASPLSAKTERLGTGWVVEERAATRLGSAAREVDALIERSGTRWRLVYHWVEASAGMPCEALRSLLALDASPWRRGVDPVVVRLATVLETPSASGRRAARERLERFAAVVEPELERLLRYMEGMSRSARRKGVS